MKYYTVITWCSKASPQAHVCFWNLWKIFLWSYCGSFRKTSTAAADFTPVLSVDSTHVALKVKPLNGGRIWEVLSLLLLLLLSFSQICWTWAVPTGPANALETQNVKAALLGGSRSISGSVVGRCAALANPTYWADLFEISFELSGRVCFTVLSYWFALFCMGCQPCECFALLHVCKRGWEEKNKVNFATL